MGYFNIYENSNGNCIVHNTRHPFKKSHTHINDYQTAKYIAYLALYKKQPRKGHLSKYLFDSLIRISDGSYKREILDIKNKKFGN